MSLAKLAREEPTIFEAMCLIEGLRRIGVKDSTCAGEVDLATRTTVENDERRDFTVQAFPDKVKSGADKALRPAGLRNGEKGLFVRVHTEVISQVWTGLIGPLPGYKDMNDFDRKWAKAVLTFGQAGLFEAEPLFTKSEAYKRLPALENLLREKGFFS